MVGGAQQWLGRVVRLSIIGGYERRAGCNRLSGDTRGGSHTAGCRTGQCGQRFGVEGSDWTPVCYCRYQCVTHAVRPFPAAGQQP